ncbi:MAG TPA: sigma-70 family RNA polymerase sigma factor [Bryobacteraceae bacterium]|nr:sigma-70 family RNA polymerase sigma factor [Bryobacteraceae bacterium]
MAAVLDIDTDLMVRVQRDDAQSFSALLHRNRALVIQFLARMVHNRDIAEELAQDVFVRVYRSRHSYEPSAKFSTWLYRITTNVALNYFRDQRRRLNNVSLDVQEADHLRREAPDHAPLAEEQLVRSALAEQIRQAIHSLPPKQRAAVIMHKYDEMDYGQIAQVLGCSSSAVKALMFRAYETLRRRLKNLSESG